MPDHDPVDTAWKIHTAIQGWTSTVDSKASFALAIESGVAVAVIGLAGENRRLHGIVGIWENLLFYAGVTLLGFALVCVAWVVRPRLRYWNLGDERRSNFIFFGHVKTWEPIMLEEQLKNQSVLPALTRQIVNTADVAWRKHVLLQVSMTLAMIAGALIVVVAMMVG
jgi:hypothetical protein